MDKRLLKILKTEFNIKDEDLFFIPGPLDLTFLMKMYGLEGYEAYKVPKYTPAPVPALQNEDDIFCEYPEKRYFAAPSLHEL